MDCCAIPTLIHFFYRIGQSCPKCHKNDTVTLLVRSSNDERKAIQLYRAVGRTSVTLFPGIHQFLLDCGRSLREGLILSSLL